MSPLDASPDGRVDLNTMALATVTGNVFAEYDYTSPVLAQEFNNNILTIFNVYNQGTTNSTSTLTQADANNVTQALSNLVTLAEKGGVFNNTPTSTKQYFLTTSMVSDLDTLLRSFQAVGVTNPTQSMTVEQLNAWRNLSVESPVIQAAMSSALEQIQENTSLQAMIETDFVATGSNLIQAQLDSLNGALNLTNGVLNTLGGVQNVLNDITVNGKASIPFSYIEPSGNYLSDYSKAASIQFGMPINPFVPSTLITYDPTTGLPTGITTAGLSVFNTLLTLRASLVSEITQVSANSNASEINDPESLLNRLKVVKGDLSTMFATIVGTGNPIPASTGLSGTHKASALIRWIVDNYNQTSGAASANAGLNNNNVTLAITAAQSLNDTQKENVRNFLFVFQEYYQSAAAVLQAIDQIIEKMAQGISQ